MSCRVQLCYHNVVLQDLICTGQDNETLTNLLLFLVKLITLVTCLISIEIPKIRKLTTNLVCPLLTYVVNMMSICKIGDYLMIKKAILHV